MSQSIKAIVVGTSNEKKGKCEKMVFEDRVARDIYVHVLRECCAH